MALNDMQGFGDFNSFSGAGLGGQLQMRRRPLGSYAGFHNVPANTGMTAPGAFSGMSSGPTARGYFMRHPTPMADELQAGGHPIAGYQSPPMMYAQHLQGGGGLMNNGQAQQFYGQQGYMPRTTTGGAWGQPGTPLEARPYFSMADAINARHQENAGGRYFQGAIPGDVGGRPGWIQPGQGGTGPMIQAYGGNRLDAPGPSLLGNQQARSLATAGMGSNQYADYQQRMGTYNDPSQYAQDMRQNYLMRQGGAMADRKAGVQRKAIARADSRARELGNLSHEQMMQFGIPGYAEAGLQAGVARQALGQQNTQFFAGIGQQEKQREQNWKLAEMQNTLAQQKMAHDKAISEGNHSAAQKLAESMQKSHERIAEMEGQTKRDVAKEAGQAQRDVAEANKGPQMAEVQQRARESQLKMAEFYRQQADEALKRGDLAGYQEHLARSNQFMQFAGNSYFGGGQQGGGHQPGPWSGGYVMPNQPPGPPGAAPQGSPQMAGGGMPGGGLPTSWASVPAAMRQQLAGSTPMQMAQNIRQLMPHLTQQQADQMIQDAHGPSGVTMYNPNGYGMSDFFGGLTGLENINRGMRWMSGRGPKPPMHPYLPIPQPVIPGIGALQTYAGF